MLSLNQNFHFLDEDCDFGQECSVNGTCLVVCETSDDCSFAQYCDGGGLCIGEPDIIMTLVPGYCRNSSDCGKKAQQCPDDVIMV